MPERMRRVNELVQEVVAEGIGELKDPRIGLVTITAVRISPDLREGTVYFSVLGAALGLRELGKDIVMHLSGESPLPGEYDFLPFGELRRDLPEDIEDRVVLALDCANERRIGPDPKVLERARLVINVDHHHDNNRFGKVNLIVADASSTAEIVRDLLGELGVPLTP